MSSVNINLVKIFHWGLATHLLQIPIYICLMKTIIYIYIFDGYILKRHSHGTWKKFECDYFHCLEVKYFSCWKFKVFFKTHLSYNSNTSTGTTTKGNEHWFKRYIKHVYLVGSSAKEKPPMTVTTFFLFSKPP